MILNLKFDYQQMSKKVLTNALNGLGLRHNIVGFGEIDIREQLLPEQIDALSAALGEFGIEVIENHKSVLVQKIKDTILEMVSSELPLQVKSSVFIADRMALNYGYLSNVFSDITHTSIENFIIIQKIELVKQLLNNSDLTLTEIADRLHYSSVAHLSTQFKNTTGITPSGFQKIIAKRKQKAKNP